jgi:hypothetical protein
VRTYKNTFFIKAMTEIKLDLLDNGIDYIYEAVQFILLEDFKSHNDSRHSWKYSVLHLYSGIELLLKEKLKQEHWSLIFQDINSASLIKFKNGDFVSVYHEELIKRLGNISEITLNNDPIKKLQFLRNRFEHFEINIALSQCQDIVAGALDEIINFWEKYLKSVSTVEQQKKFIQIKVIATRFEAYREQRLNKFKQAISGIVENKKGLIVVCPYCSSLSFAIFKDDKKECKCFVCDEKSTKDDHLKSIRKGEDDDKEYSLLPYKPYDVICPSCQQETRIRDFMSDEITSYYCLNCLNQEEELMKKKVDPEFEEYLTRLENATGQKEFLKILAEKHTVEEIYELLQDMKKIDSKLEKD